MVDTNHPARRCNLFAYTLGRVVMKVCGWKIKGKVPDSKKMIVIASPHTSNWDFIFLLGAAYCFRLSVNWLGKKSLFPPVWGAWMKYLGGVPIDRSRNTNMVQKLAEDIKAAPNFTLVIPASGTRRKTDYWKSGFYQIALAAQIPIVCGYLDYADKVACLGYTFIPTGDVRADMDKVREFYEPIQGKNPENTSRIRLREEDNDEALQP